MIKLRQLDTTLSRSRIFAILIFFLFSFQLTTIGQTERRESKPIDLNNFTRTPNAIENDKSTRANFDVIPGLTPEELVDILLGTGVTVSNISFTGNAQMAGSFSGSSNLGIASGIILSSGEAEHAEGPDNNNGGSGGDNFNLPGDSDLTQIAAIGTNDACILEFDFIPQSDSVEFKYVFGSEEYPEYNDGPFNDAFGFFVSGPDITGNGSPSFINDARNIAIVPNSDPEIFVTIMNINSGDNSEYYVNNEGGRSIQYDGFTTVLTATMVVTPCETYHMKLAIADGSDHAWDSGVFLEASSFSSTGVSFEIDYESQYIDTIAYEGCNTAEVTFELTTEMDTDITIPLEIITGPEYATEIIDYNTITDELVIPAGQLFDGFTIDAINDGITEGFEKVYIRYNTSICSNSYDTIKLWINDYTPLGFDIREDTTLYCDDQFLLYGDQIGGLEPYFYNWSTGDDTETVLITPTESQTYVLELTDACGDPINASMDVTMLPPSAYAGEDQETCRYDEIILTAEGGTNWNWSTGETTQSIEVEPSTTTTYIVNVSDNCGNSDQDEVEVAVSQTPQILAGNNEFLCEIEPITFFGTAKFNCDSVRWFHDGTGELLNGTSASPTYTPTAADFLQDSVVFTYTGYNFPCDSATSVKILRLYNLPTIEAGPDDTICETGTYNINNATAQFYSGLSWTTLGDGSFDDNTILNSIYTPGTTDITNGIVELVLEAVHETPCVGDFHDTILLKITPLPTVDAGIDTNICSNDLITIHNALVADFESYIWTTDGAGILTDENTLSPTYTPDPADFTTGTVTISLTASIVHCADVIDTKILNMFIPPTVAAGIDDTICSTETYPLNGATASDYSGIQWTTNGSGIFSDDTDLNPTYTPSAGDNAAGEVELYIEALTATPCDGDFKDTVRMIIKNEILLTVGADTSLCGPVDHNIISFDGINYDEIEWTSTGTGVFSNLDVDPLHPIYTPSNDDVTTQITLTATASNTHCPPKTQSLDAVVYVIPLIYPGNDTTICENQTLDIQNANVLHFFSLTWSSDGTGAFSNTGDMNPVYTPSTDDINNGGTILHLAADTATTCTGPFIEARQLSILLNPTVNAGNDSSWCEAIDHQITGVVAADQDAILWTTSGSGSFIDATVLNPIYTPSEADMDAGSVTLTITVSNIACDPVSDDKIVSLYRMPIYEAGDDQTVCSYETVQIAGSSVQYNTGILWTTDGSGTFDDDSILAPIYTPSAGDLANATVILTMEALTDGSCGGPYTDNFTVTIIPEPILEVGNDTTVCNLIAHNILNVIAQEYQTIVWSTSGTGIFTNGDTDAPSYTPSDADYTTGTITLTATLTQTACADISDSFEMTIVKDPVTFAGNDATICSIDTHTLNDATITEYYTSLSWISSGSGSFDDNTILASTYLPSAADIAAGSVILTLEAFSDAPCTGPFTSSMTLTIMKDPILEVGNDTLVCELIPHTINGVIAQNYQTISWSTSGSGSFTNGNTDTPSYNPSAADYTAGTVTLTATLEQTSCSDLSDSFVMSIVKSPVVNAGVDADICSSENYSLSSATISEHYTSIVWSTSGNGNFDDNGLVNPIYNPSIDDITAGQVTLTMEAFTNAPCPSTFIDQMVLDINYSSFLDAGPDTTVCNIIPHTIVGAVAQDYQTITWSTSGNGTFNGGNTETPIYTPSAEDYNTGTITITATLTQTACSDNVDSFELTIVKSPEVNAGVDATICSIDIYSLADATIEEYYSALAWSTSGTGSFSNTTIVNPIYTPSAADIASGNVVLTLEAFSDAPCPGLFVDQMSLFINEAPILEAGNDTTVCDLIAHSILGASASNYQNITWSTSGSGIFSAGNTITPNYTPSGDDYNNGSVVITATLVQNPCADISDSFVLTIKKHPEVYAGSDVTICSIETFSLADATISEHYTALSWSSTGTGSFSNTTIVNPLYTPSAADIANGGVTLSFEAFTDAPCPGTFIDQMTLSINEAPVLEAGNDTTVCDLIGHTILGAFASNYQNITWSTSGSGTFSGANTIMPTYTPSGDDYNNGSVVITATLVQNPCADIADSFVLTIKKHPETFAGSDVTICSIENYSLADATINEYYTALAWSSTGTGSFSNTTIVNPIYFPSAADIANGGVTLSFEAFTDAPCPGTFVDQMTLSINEAPVLEAGNDTTVCDLIAHTILGATAQNYQSITWTTSGNGSFSGGNTVTPAYTPSEGDYNNGSVVITATLVQAPCADITDSFVLNIKKHPETYAGSDVTICSIETYSLTDATINEYYTALAWSTTGTGSFSNTTIVNPIYFPSAADIANGGVTLSFEAFTDAPCPGSFVDQMTITINEAPILEAGNDTTVCDIIGHTLLGVTAQNYQSITWNSSGSGSFTNGNSDTPTYTPSEADYINGSVILTVTLVQTPCADITDQLVMTIVKHPEVFAGNDFTICEIESPVLDQATISEHYTSFNWSSTGSGSFNNNSILNPIYIPSIDDANNGTVTLTLEAFTDAPCPGIFADQVIVTINMESVIDAGSDQLVCNTIPHLIDGAIAANYQSLFWASSGSGTFSAGNTITPTYTPSVADMDAGSVVLTLTVSNPPCVDFVDQMTLSISHPPVVDAGEDQIMCAQEPFVIPDASASYYTSLAWTSSGSGSVVNGGTLAPQYIPSEADIIAGNITLTLEAFTDNPCDGTYTSQMILSIVPQPIVNAGANTTICESDTLFITDASVINYQEVFWNGTGTGSFINSSTLNPAYIPSADDITNSPISLTLNAINEPCTIVSDARTLSVIPMAQAYAGNDTVILPGLDYHNTIATVENYSYFLWTTDGTGHFDNPTFANPIYFASPMDTLRRFVRLTLTAQAMGGCGTVSDEMILVFSHNPYVDFFYPTAAWEQTPVYFATDTIVTDTDKVIEYAWDFGDGTFSDEMNPVHTYSNFGEYDVTLTITDTLFNQYSATHRIVVNRLPFAFFSYEQPVCSGSNVSFTDQSNAVDDYITSWHWNFGDGTDTLINFPDSPNVEHIFPLDMTYDVTLSVETSLGGFSNYTQAISVSPSPIALFNYSDTCENMAAQFTSNSVANGGGELISHLWNFGDPASGVNNTAEGISAYHIYSTAGDYLVQHIVESSLGCSDTVVELISVLAQPEVDFNFVANCQDQPVSFIMDETVTNIADLSLWHWDFGDGGESFEQAPVHTYAAAGTYTVTLTIENTAGCSNEVSHVLTVSDAPSALFDYSSPTCFGNAVDFVYISNPGAAYIVTWEWDFGNGQTSNINFPNDPNVSQDYADAGTYQVQLTVTNVNGCVSVYATDVVVSATPVANLSFDDACENNEVSFTSLAQGNVAGTITSHFWDFGDDLSGVDNNSLLANPTHIYVNAGTYDVSYTVTAINGCMDTKDTTIVVSASPEVDFSFVGACLGDPTTFNASDFVNAAEIGTYFWDFGDGATSNNVDPDHIYVIAGSYDVVLTVTDINGCSASVTKTVDVLSAPSAAFIYSGLSCSTAPIAFDDQSVADELISQWVWDFGDGTIVTIDYPTNPDIEHEYLMSGDFEVILSIVTESGCENTITNTISINTAPEALIEYTANCINEPFSFSGDALLNGGTGIWQWQWDFGDPLSGAANTSELQNATHVYTQAGVYPVSLIAINVDGCSDTAFVDITVGNLAFIDLIVSTPVCMGDSVSIDPDVANMDMDAINFISWDLGDGTVIVADSVDYIYDIAGTYEIIMSVTDTAGCVQSASAEVMVNEKPTVQFDASLACQDNATTFTDLSYLESGEPIIAWSWNFGDNLALPEDNVSVDQNPIHLYQEPGTYTVSLAVTSVTGCMDSTTMDIAVLLSPTADYSYDTTNCEVGRVDFFDNSIGENGPIVAWQWTFQDGYYSDLQHPFHIFDQVDECYEVQLVIFDINGCMDTIVDTVCTAKPFEMDFKYSHTCLSDITYFNDTLISPVGDSIIAWNWNFGDPNSGVDNVSTLSDPNHEYTVAGNYVVTMDVVDENYCTYSISKTIDVFPLPVAMYTSHQPLCSDDVFFTDISTGSLSQINTWIWSWGDGTANETVTTAQTAALAHEYLVDGEYTVSLTVINDDGCEQTYTELINKLPCLQADFDLDAFICARIPVQITDLSIPIDYIISWNWDFGDNTVVNSTEYIPVFEHRYVDAGEYTITLIINGSYQGEDLTSTMTKQVQVLSSPRAAFTADSVCHSFNTLFIDQSTDSLGAITSWSWDFGDQLILNDVSTNQDDSWIYDNPGRYDVELIISNEFGCSDRIINPTRVYSRPTAGFDWDTSCVTKPTYFYDTSYVYDDDQQAVAWLYEFGIFDINWDASTAQDAYWAYDTIGVHHVFFQVTDNHGCWDSVSADINTYVVPFSNFTYVSDYDDTQGKIKLTNLAEGADSFEWHYNDLSTIEFEPEIQLTDDGDYPIRLIAINDLLCSDTMTQLHTQLFKTLFVPNAFSPNNAAEGVREFKVVGRNISEFSMKIYDLRGNIVFETTELDDQGRPTQGWDGTVNGFEMPSGVYLYRIQAVFTDGTIYNGSVVGDHELSAGSNESTLILIR